MRTTPAAFALLLIGSAVCVQVQKEDPSCRSDPARPGCQPTRIQVVPSPQTPDLKGLVDDPEFQRFPVEERVAALRKVKAPPEFTKAYAEYSWLVELLVTDHELVVAQPSEETRAERVTMFIARHPDWEEYGPKMLEYSARLRPAAKANEAEYVTLLYRLAQIDERLREDEFAALYSSPLVVRVRSKYPGAYAETTNDDLEDAWLAKHPEYVDLASPRARAKLLAKHPEYADLAPPAAEPTPQAPTPEERAQGTAFIKAHADWENYAPKMRDYGTQLRPAETDATEYLTFLYRLAKMEQP